MPEVKSRGLHARLCLMHVAALSMHTKVIQIRSTPLLSAAPLLVTNVDIAVHRLAASERDIKELDLDVCPEA